MLLSVHRHSAIIVLETVVSETSCYIVTLLGSLVLCD